MIKTTSHKSGQILILGFMACGLLAMFIFAINFRVQNPSLTQVAKQSKGVDQSKMMTMVGQLMEKLKENPQDASTLETLGMIFVSLQDWERASHFWKRLIEVDKNNARAHQQLALCLFRNQKYNQAVDHLQRVLEIDPQNAYAHYNLAMIYSYYLDQKAKGNSFFEKLLQLDNVEQELRQKARQELEASQN